MKSLPLILSLCILTNISLSAQKDTLHVFGPGGPYPAINEAAQIFSQENDIVVSVTKGPLPNWEAAAHQKADLIYSGSEDMMSLFMSVFEDELLPETIEPLYFRKSGLVVRKGNPKNIKKLEDLQKPGLQILIVRGAGLAGVWEDMLGNLKNKEVFRKIRKNIVVFAANSGVAQNHWITNPDIDVWITWDIWQKMNQETADFIKVKKKYTIQRNCGIGITKKGEQNQASKQFADFLRTEKAHAVFRKWGWQ